MTIRVLLAEHRTTDFQVIKSAGYVGLFWRAGVGRLSESNPPGPAMSGFPGRRVRTIPKLRSAAASNLLPSLEKHMSPHRGFDERTGVLRFMVPMGHEQVVAFISQTTWRARYGVGSSDASLLELYLENQAMIDAIVVRKVNAGGHNPVVLMASDL